MEYSLDNVYKPKMLAIVKRILINKFAINFVATKVVQLFFFTPVQNKFLTALAKIGPTSYLPFTTTKPKAYVKNNSTCPNDSTVTSRKV
jgi:hypothetical protein